MGDSTMGLKGQTKWTPTTSHVMRLEHYETERGERLDQVEIAYETCGTMNANGTNVVLICHALTGDAHAADSKSRQGWWGPLIGPGRAIDTNRYFVVSSNVLGGCAGTTGPASLIPGTDRVYGSKFPLITIRDMVHVQYYLLRQLGVRKLHAVLGGSMGGMQALEWPLLYPNDVARAVVIAANPAFSAMGLAYNEVMRCAIQSDSNYLSGEYAAVSRFPEDGMRIARMIGMITYRTAQLFEQRFGRQFSSEQPLDAEVARYLRYQGDKFVARFDAESYLTLLRAMDLHDIGEGRGGMRAALQQIKADLLWIGIRDDLLYPPTEIRQAVELARTCRVSATYAEIDSVYGHDAFLLEFEQLSELIAPFLAVTNLDEQAL
ncbi:homoserine O-acetyltransferase MetX [Sulfoacidibacillus thermotolerans]|nr:homoserine O-acetyltransferase [Sulfoacidibacillus thermotolerans]